MENKFRSLAKCSEKRQEKKIVHGTVFKKKKNPPKPSTEQLHQKCNEGRKVPRHKQKIINTVPKSPRCRLQKLKVIIVRRL